MKQSADFEYFQALKAENLYIEPKKPEEVKLPMKEEEVKAAGPKKPESDL